MLTITYMHVCYCRTKYMTGIMKSKPNIWGYICNFPIVKSNCMFNTFFNMFNC